MGGAKVHLGGGQDANGIEIADKVQDSANSAMERLFPQFSEADHANWGQVVTRARAGDVGALSLVGHAGNATTHPVCRRILDAVGAGKKGKEIRDQFKAAPFGWPQDAIDGALFLLIVAGNLRATLNNAPVLTSGLPQNQIGVANFYVDVPPLNVAQRLDLKALFQKAGVTTANGKESEAAATFLQNLLGLAEKAGGEAPRPECPDTRPIRDLQMLSGNAQLNRIHDQKDALADFITAWKQSGDSIAKRWPHWERLLDYQAFASTLPAGEACAKSLTAITSARSLLSEPDPVPALTRDLTTALRAQLSDLQTAIASAFQDGEDRLASSSLWGRLDGGQRATISADFQLAAPKPEVLGSDEEILAALRSRNLTDRKNLLDAVPQRFTRALEEATRLLEPKAVRVTLPSASLKSTEDLDQWLSEVRALVEDQLKEGPVIL
jgi:hypothetical protein